VKVDGMVALKTIASFKASYDLSWRQFDLVKTSFLIHIEKNGWLKKHQQALALFFMLTLDVSMGRKNPALLRRVCLS
jgi:hypothetical protein